MKKIITAALACAMIISSLCACAPANEEMPALPEKYNLLDEGRVTPTRDQGVTTHCAAYSTLKSAESNLIINGYADKDEVDFSEAHTFYYYLIFQDEKNIESPEDGIYYSGSRLEDDGRLFSNNFASLNSVIGNMYANGIGPVEESVMPAFDPDDYRASVSGFHDAHSSGKISKYMGDYLAVEINAYDSHAMNISVYEKSELEAIKRGIMENGAVACAIPIVSFYFNDSEDGYCYFNDSIKEENALRYMNHSTTIIGWDDNFSRENFGTNKPENDGAWLIQDSQGTEFGDGGCYWVSYEQLLPNKMSVGLCPRDNYGAILFFDSHYLLDYIRDESGDTVTANVFTVQKDSVLKGVGVPSSALNQPVKIEIFRNPDEGCPDSGKRMARLSTTIETPGYHVIDLSKAVKLSKGDSFSVVVTYTGDKTCSNEWLGRVPVEGEYRKDVVELQPSMAEFVMSSNAGESFVMHGGEWHDTSESATAELFGLDVTINNFGIKALMENDG